MRAVIVSSPSGSQPRFSARAIYKNVIETLSKKGSNRPKVWLDTDSKRYLLRKATMENPQYEQLQLFYTQEEVDAKLSAASTEQAQAVDRAYSNTSSILRDKAIAWFKSEVREGNMAKEDAQGILDGLFMALNWTGATLTFTYTVTVSFRGREVGTFEEVEADDAESAENLVLENMGIDTTLNVELDYNGDSISDEIGLDSWDFSDDFTAEAEEE